MTQTNNTFVADFNNTYNATSNLNPMDYPASIISLCDYILSNDKENIDWNAAGNMFRCFNNEDNTFLFHSFKNAAQSVTFFVKVMGVGFNEVMDGAYSALIHRVETLKESCKELLMETAKANAANKELEEKVADLNCYCDGCIEEIFEASDADADTKVFGIVLADKNENIMTFYDMASHSVVIEDLDGEELYTTLEDFTEDFIKFCTEKFGKDYTQYWTYTAA